MSEKQIIRWAEAKDAGQIVRLIKALASYENEPPDSVKVTEADILRDGFGEPGNTVRRFECLIAEHRGTPVGLCLFFHNYSTWEGRAGIYVEDLFVEEQARGYGLGRILLAALARVALERNCRRIDLSVLHWNPTREFYHHLNMICLEEWRPYRMDRSAIAALANTSPEIGGVR
jgi:GNAT superfamily N-acetyltransferase